MFNGGEPLFKTGAALQKKLELLKEFFRLTALQQQALACDDIQRFNELIEARQKIINIVDGLDKEITFHTQACRSEARQAEQHDAGTEKSAGEIQRLNRNIRECLQQISKLNRQVMLELEAKYHTLVKTMRNMRTARQVDTLYRNKARQMQACFVDKKK